MEKDLLNDLTRLATSLGAELRWVTVPSAPQYRYIDELDVVVGGGAKVAIRARTGGKGALIGATFTIELNAPLIASPVTMRRENAIDRLGKNLFINREFQFGDEAFDRAVYIESDASDASLQRLLSGSSVRNAIAEIVSGIAEHVAFSTPVDPNVPPDLERVRRSISVAVPVSKFGHRDAIVRMMQTLVQLGQFVERERQPDPLEPAAPARISWPFVVALALSFSTWVVAWACAAFISGPATIGWRAYERGTYAGVVCWVAIVALSIAVFRGRSTSFRVVVILAFLWLGVVLVCGTAAERLNAGLDHGPRASFEGTAHMAYGGKGPPRKRVTVPSLASEIVVPNDVVDAALDLRSAPTGVRVMVGEGAFGSKWIASVERR